MEKLRVYLFSLFVVIFLSPITAAAAPKLVVVFVIDQFRADNIVRYESRFLPPVSKNGTIGGFHYLTNRGAYFPYGQYDILQPMTGPGHATILSGSYPYLGGIATNEWYDTQKKSKVYCVEDSEFETVGKVGTTKHLGTSPRNFLGTTVGDELKNAGWPSQVVSIALKDRAAILLGGHRADIALWVDPNTFTWVSSRYYLNDKKLPKWMTDLNSRLAARAGQKFLWDHPKQSETSFSIFNIQREGKYVQSIGESFPHTITRGTLSELTSPAGLDLTAEAAEAAVSEMKLGAGRGTDLLAISFSSHDYVGHAFGPNSRENEEMVIAEDKTLSRLINFLKNRVPGGLKNVLFVLTADHGVAPNAEWLASERVNAGVVDTEELTKRLEAGLSKKFGKLEKGSWIAYANDFNFWLNRDAIQAKNLTLEVVAQELKSLLLQEKAFAYAITESDVLSKHLPPGLHERRILKTYVPGRSGDVIAIARPFFYMKENTANHMADYSYDETVPIIIAGAGVKPGKYATKAEVVDIAPTLSFLIGTIPPSLSEGRVLPEAIPAKN